MRVVLTLFWPTNASMHNWLPSYSTVRSLISLFFQSNFFAALDDSDNEGKAAAPAVATKKKAAPAPQKEVVEPSKVENRP